MDEKTCKAFYRAIDRVNKAYDTEDYDTYEELLERYARKFGKPVWRFEDDCTDVRPYGKNAC